MDPALSESTPLLQAIALGYERNAERVFGPLDFSLRPGEIVLIEGDNGSGKTTLLKVLSGLLPPSSGEILLHGAPLTLARLSHQVALLGHQLGLKMELSTLQNLRFAVGLGGIRPGITPRIALASVGLEGYEDQPLRTLSAGQRKRVALARLALSAAKTLWLLDEPYASLDADGIDCVSGLCASHLAGGGMLVLTSHQHVDIAGAAERALELGGRAA